MSDEVLKVIEDLQSDEELTSLSEAHVSQSVVLRVLSALNWNTYNHREVSSQYSVEKKSVDLALLTGNTTTVFIEVKKGGESLERHQEQLLDYTFRHGVKIAALTNGATWWFYLPLREGSWKQRKFDTVEFHKQDTGEITQKLADFLGRENVSSGKAVQNAEALYKKHRTSATLPEAWNQLVSEPDDLLVELLADKTNELCEHKPDKNAVEQFLSAHFQNIKITPPSTTVEPTRPSETKPSDRRKGTKPTAFTFNGKRYEVKAWTEMLVRLCEIVHTAHRNRFTEVLSRKAHFSEDPNNFRASKQINRTGIYVNTSKGKDYIIKTAEKLITHFGYDKSNLSFEEIQ